MNNKIKNFFFYTTLVLSKTKFKLNWFFQLKKNSSISKIFSFWKSLSRFSDKLSTSNLIRIFTLKKIWNKIFFNFFIKNLLLTEKWLSFTELDLNNFQDWNFYTIWKKIKLIMSTTSTDFSILWTNKIFNKIFKDFFSIKLFKKTNYSSFFLESYFLKEKYTWGLGLTNNLRFLFIRFFSFFIPNVFSLKKLFFLRKKHSKLFFLNKLNNFMQLFLNKRFFIFIKNTITTDTLNEIIIKLNNDLPTVDLIFFLEGKIFSKNQQFIFSKNNVFSAIKSIDSNFINFFSQINRLNFLSFKLLSNFSTNKITNKTNLIFLFFNKISISNFKIKFILIKFFYYLLEIKFKFYFTNLNFCFFKFLFFKTCQLLNN